ncbi:hypothetical protein [Micromonospora siamensis]|uniref:PH domain-containing protein n=1 Tax=Micromonospora siamensis TaxID=299152 RepID=A0A1C5I998_9ACTN|nr:hypothetical protein [Micromonospora siamensis]SCG54887.1 hypothetical protein GA0074704_3097 [Micromonospora siamensis]
MTGVDAAGGVRFERSRARMLAWLAGTLVAVTAAAGAVNALVFDEPWWDLWTVLPVFLLGTVGSYVRIGRQKGLPLLVTPQELVLTRPDGSPLVIERAALAVTEVRRRHLVLVVADPQRTRPVLSAYEWGELGFWNQSRRPRPHEIQLPLFGIRPGVDRLRAALGQVPSRDQVDRATDAR